MTELFADLPNALENTLKIAEECNVMIELHKSKLPKFPTEDGSNSREFARGVMLERF